MWENIHDIASNVKACFAYCDIVKLSRDELNFLAKHSETTGEDSHSNAIKYRSANWRF
ncbi:hypothetical protein P4S68_02540 [Pseudoalteromonas sp. Hal099]